MPYRTTWKTKDGSVKTKVYKTIKGQEAGKYKRIKDAEYRARKRAQQQHIGTATTNKRTKISQVPEETVDKMREVYAMGMQISRIAKHFGLTRYTVEMILLLPHDRAQIFPQTET